MASQVRIGLLGCGRVGTAHARALRGVSDARLVAVVDREPERAAAVAEGHSARVLGQAGDLIDSADVDAVIISLPTHLHAPFTLQAVAAGKHVLCEKPMAMSVTECDAMMSAAAAHGVVLMVGHDLRFSAPYREAKAALASGMIGRPLAFSAERLSGASATTWRRWIRHAGEGLGALDALIHDLDVALWFFGPATTVSAHGARGPGGTWDHVQVLLNHVYGCASLLEASLMVPPSFPFTSSLRVVGDEGTVIRRFVGGRTFRDAGVDTGLVLYRGESPPQVLAAPAPDSEASLERELATFVQAVRTGYLPQEAQPATARAALALAEQVGAALAGP
jgi:predicted dehydrogenase